MLLMLSVKLLNHNEIYYIKYFINDTTLMVESRLRPFSLHMQSRFKNSFAKKKMLSKCVDGFVAYFTIWIWKWTVLGVVWKPVLPLKC